MSPLPAADTSSQMERPAAAADSPTARTTDGPQKPAAAKSQRAKRAPTKPKARALTVDEALGSPMRQFTTRAAEDVLALLKERAEAIAAALPADLRGGGPGGALRIVLTDAIAQALEMDVEEHAERVRQTRGRELMAQTKAKIG